jgi:hypothetical protein
VEPDHMNGDEPRTDALSGAAEHELVGQARVPPVITGGPEVPPATSPKPAVSATELGKVGALQGLRVLLRRLVIGPAAPPVPGGAQPPQPDHLKDCLAMLDARPGLRTTTIRLLGPHAADEGASFLHEHVETEDEKGNARQTDLYVTYRCSNNHWLDQNVRVLGTCFCGAILCSTPGCFAVCSTCSVCCCSHHRKSYIEDGQVVTYCTRCFWKKYWFW